MMTYSSFDFSPIYLLTKHCANVLIHRSKLNLINIKYIIQAIITTNVESSAILYILHLRYINNIKHLINIIFTPKLGDQQTVWDK